MNNPNDTIGIYKLAYELYCDNYIDESTILVNKLLKLEPNNISGLLLMSKVLIKKQNPVEALKFVKKEIDIHNKNVNANRMDSETKYTQQYIYQAYWNVLRENRCYADALSIARILDKEYGLSTELQYSLIDNDYFAEAEVHWGTSPEGRSAALCRIAYVLSEEKRYEQAIPFFLKCFPYIIQPKDFFILVNYIQCLALANHIDEAENLLRFWVNSGKQPRDNMGCLCVMSAVLSHISGDMEMAKNKIENLITERGIKKVTKYARWMNIFIDFYSHIEILMSEAQDSTTNTDNVDAKALS